MDNVNLKLMHIQISLVVPFAPATLTRKIRPEEDIKSATVSPLFHESKFS